MLYAFLGFRSFVIFVAKVSVALKISCGLQEHFLQWLVWHWGIIVSSHGHPWIPLFLPHFDAPMRFLNMFSKKCPGFAFGRPDVFVLPPQTFDTYTLEVDWTIIGPFSSPYSDNSFLHCFRKNVTKHGGCRVFVCSNFGHKNETYFRSKLVVEQPILNGLRSAKRAAICY